ncbi:MAG: DNA translocase FtsK [Spirochaetaceae bacterium]|nr:DNA translocase FtsK [Spirochaetaceae bacterium]
MHIKTFFAGAGSRYRIAAIGCALALSALALILAFSIGGALFNLPFMGRRLGAFLTGAYGILALLIPAYLIWAALILAAPGFRPDRIFVLAAAIIPFMTIAIGIGFIQDFDFQSGRFPALLRVGRNGLSLFILLLGFVEGLIIRAFLPLLFPELRPAGKPGPGLKERLRRALAFRSGPAAKAAGAVESAPPETPGESPEAPAEASVGDPGGDPAETVIDFPRPRPLASARALEDLEAKLRGGGSPDAGIYGEVLYYAELPEEDGSDDEDGRYSFPEPELSPEPRPHNGAPLLDSLEILDEGKADPEAEESRLKPVFVSTPPPRISPAGAPEERVAGGRPSVSRLSKKQNQYRIPVEGILNQYPDGQYWIIDQGTEDAAVVLQKTLEEFNIQAEVTGIKKGPVITMFEILPAPGVKLSRIVNLQDNIALRLAASSVRIVAPIPGKHAVGIEVPNKKRNIVSFREIIEGELQNGGKGKDGKKEKQGIPVALGKDITGEAQTVDLTQTPHLLIAGSTGSGKSVCVNAIILSILYQLPPAECRLILIDPKIVELKLYNEIPHLLTQVITEPKRAFQALQYCIFEMERRYSCLDSMGVRDIKSYNRRIRERNIAAEYMPYIVVVIDEFADLMATTGKELESTVARLAAMSRAVGIHLVLATQRPSIDVITGLIKANIPSRIAFMVASKMDSRIIIDQVGAEKLLGKGDMLYAGVVDPFPVRMQGAFVSEEEVERVVDFVKTLGEPDYIDEEIFYDEDEEESDPSLFSDGEDPLYDKAFEIVVQQGKASASYIQRRLKIGYNRAARIVEEMASRGVVGPAQGSKPRELLRGA